jgi:hypothetical protein
LHGLLKQPVEQAILTPIASDFKDSLQVVAVQFGFLQRGVILSVAVFQAKAKDLPLDRPGA